MKLLFLAASFYLLMSSCSDLKVPRPILYCTTDESPNVKWDHGKAIINMDFDTQFYTFINYEKSDEAYHYFKYGILSQSETPVLFNPKNIFFTTLTNGNAQTFSAIDPEEMILKMRYQNEWALTEAENKVIRAKNAQTAIVLTTIGVALTAATIAAIDDSKNNTHNSNSKSYSKNNSNHLCNTNYSIPIYSVSNMEYNKNLTLGQLKQNESIQEENNNRLIRKTTLYKDQTNEGVFLIPIVNQIPHSFCITIPIDSSHYGQFVFNQRVYNPSQLEPTKNTSISY